MDNSNLLCAIRILILKSTDAEHIVIDIKYVIFGDGVMTTLMHAKRRCIKCP